MGLIAERAGSPCSLEAPISPPPSTADAITLARGEPDGGGDVSGDGSRIQPRAERERNRNSTTMDVSLHFETNVHSRSLTRTYVAVRSGSRPRSGLSH